MNFDFSDDVGAMREEVRRFLDERLPPGAAREALESGAPMQVALWREMAAMGWLGLTIPEDYGGAALGYEPLCMVAEEIGRALAPVPFASTLYLATEALLLFGSDAQKRRWLPAIAEGRAIGAFALAEGAGEPGAVASRARGGRVSGRKLPVWDGAAADFMIVAARDEGGEIGLQLVEAGAVAPRPLPTLEIGDAAAVSILFDDVPAEPLTGARTSRDVERLLDRAAVPFAFEQVGGAQGALDMAIAYARQRHAFGRPIGALQAVKHQLADIYVAIELARSNAYYGAWALDHDEAALPLAAAAARVAATEALEKASIQNIQTHGGMGFTWESDCQLYHRRAKRLSGVIGSARHWRARLVERLVHRTRAA